MDLAGGPDAQAPKGIRDQRIAKSSGTAPTGDKTPLIFGHPPVLDGSHERYSVLFH
jgi:hypothetical protein